MKTGRKSLKEEIQIVERMAELSIPVFKFVKSCFESEEKGDKKWASEQMMKLYAKAVPTEITGESGGALVITIAKEVAEKNNVTYSESNTNSTGLPQV